MFALWRGWTLQALAVDAPMAYFYSLALAKELLGQLAARLGPAAWARFAAERRWALCGFGAPVYLLVRRSPLAVLALLDFFVCCAAVFAHRELRPLPPSLAEKGSG